MISDDEFQDAQYRYTQNQNAEMRRQNEMMEDSENQNIVREQLNLNEELERIEHLLRGHVIRYDEKGMGRWVEPEDKEMIILSEYGIQLILNTITWYINKNTLLSNYDEDTILTKMEDFATDLSDTIFMEYEKVFQYPSFEECKAVLDSRKENKMKLMRFANEIGGRQIEDTILSMQIDAEMEDRIEKEMAKIKEQIMKNKLKRFLMLIRVIQDAVHSTYLRAYKGMERRTLREHIHTTENIGGTPMPPRNAWSPINWFRRK